MAATERPLELTELLDLSERPRASQWSLRAALTRYAQPQPERASAIMELVRRTEHALRPFAKALERDAAPLQAAVSDDGATDVPFEVALLRAMRELDRLGDVLATWAVHRDGDRPDSTVDAVVADVTARLEQLGVPREERPRPAARGGSGR